MRAKRFARWANSLLPVLGCLLVVAMATPAAHAANNCPWLNEATASGLLGGEATGNFQAADGTEPAVCTFRAKIIGAERELEIEITTTPDFVAHLQSLELECEASATPMKAIGNEAATCRAKASESPIDELVVGRVRDQVFKIQLSSTVKSDPVLTSDNLAKRMRQAAEEVTGNLF